MKIAAMITLGVALALFAGCATKPGASDDTYVPSSTYKDHSCEEIDEEVARVKNDTLQSYRTLLELLDRTLVVEDLMGDMHWTGLFWLGGNSPDTMGLVRLGNDYAALRENAAFSNCDMAAFRPAEKEVPDLEAKAHKIKRKRAGVCPWRAPNRGLCRRNWAIEHPQDAALLGKYESQKLE
jgi:hypothetical protein